MSQIDLDCNIIGFGKMIADYLYYFGDKEAKIDGGGTVWNVLFNLSYLGKCCYAIGECGDDKVGKICLSSLKKSKVSIDISHVKIKPRTATDRVFIEMLSNGKSRHNHYCHICGNSQYSRSSLLRFTADTFSDFDKGIVLFDMIDIRCVKDIIKYELTKKFLLSLILLNEEQLQNIKDYKSIFTHFKILFISKKMANKIEKELKITEEQLFLLGNNILIIMDLDTIKYNIGKKIISLKNKCETIVNDTGKYEAIVASFLDAYVSTETKQIEESFKENLELLLSSVLQNEGARGYYQSAKKYELPNCQFCGIKHIKNKNNIITNVNSLFKQLEYCINSSGYDLLENILLQCKGRILCIGTGGSYTTATYASRVLMSKFKRNSLPCHPIDVLTYNVKIIDVFILFSYSGTTLDILKIINQLSKLPNKKIILITKMNDKKELEALKEKKVEIISYGTIQNYYFREKGFISISGTICPSSLFARLNFKKSKESWLELIDKIWQHWSDYFDNYFLEPLKINIKKNKIKIIDIFYSFDCLSVARDLESKFTESGFGRVTLHEKKDFSHGRFNILHYSKPDFIIFIINSFTNYDEMLINYLKFTANVEVIILDLEKLKIKDSLVKEFGLLIGAQLLFNKISNYANRDLAKPDYPDEALNLYKFQEEIKPVNL